MSQTVMIGCKLPNGILMSATLDGKLVEKRINGWNQQKIEGAHGLTHDVPESLWQAWLSEHKESRLVKGGFIFAHKKEREVKAEAKDKKTKKSGLEGMEQIKKKSSDAKEGQLAAMD